MGSFIIYTDSQILLGRSNQENMVGWAYERRVKCTRFRRESLKDHVEDRGEDGRMGS